MPMLPPEDAFRFKNGGMKVPGAKRKSIFGDAVDGRGRRRKRTRKRRVAERPATDDGLHPRVLEIE